MLWLLLACAARRGERPLAAALPVSDVHTGRHIDAPRAPLHTIRIDTADPKCAPLVAGLEHVWRVHAGQQVSPLAPITVTIQSCDVQLDERIRADLTRSEAEGDEVLAVLLSGVGWAMVTIVDEQGDLESIRVDAWQVEQPVWIAGGRYPWREPLAAAVTWKLVEELEVSLLPLPLLRDLSP